MAYQINPKKQMEIREMIKKIYDENIKNPSYVTSSIKGSAYNMSKNKKNKIENKIKELFEEKKRMRGNAYIGGMVTKKGYGQCCNMCGRSYMNAGRYQKNIKRVKAGHKSVKHNKWVKFYKKWLIDNKHTGGREGMRLASIEYRKIMSGY